MAPVYFDSSALVKLVVTESGSQLARDLWNGADFVFTNRIAYPEVRAALGAARRDHRLSSSQFRSAATRWEAVWSELQTIEVTPKLAETAGDLAVRHALGGADAIHLASAEAVGMDSLVLAVWDRRLHAGACAAHVVVAPVELSAP